jgi:hypothetical protein
MDDNPYASPRYSSENPERRPDIYVDGQFIVVRDNAVLPSRCVITNEAVSAGDRRTRGFEWAPSFRLVLARHRCRLSYCVNRKHRLGKYRIRFVVGLASILAGWLFLGIHVLWIVPVILMVLASLSVDRLRVTAVKDDQFWLTGFGDAFLKSCENEYGIF